MKILLLITLFWMGPAFSTDACEVLLSQMSVRFGHGFYESSEQVKQHARAVVEKLGREYPHLSSHQLTRLLEFAFENAAIHGSSGSGASVDYSLKHFENGWLEIRIANPKVSDLPPSLVGKTFTSESQILEVPKEERQPRTAGRQGGAGTPNMIKILKQVVDKSWPTAGPAEFRWEEGPTQIEFVLRLPPHNRVLRERRRTQ